MNAIQRSTSGGPLAGIRVLDFTQVIAGPACSQTLADFGAEVIKVEPLHGDPGRDWGTWRDDGRSFLFFAVNRNKRSVAIDIGHPEAQPLLDELARTCDAVLVSMSVDAAERHRLTYERFAELRPDVVYCTITGYGATTERRYERAYDQMLQAEVGIMAMGASGREAPGRLPVSAIDLLAANAAATAVCAELVRQPRRGANLDASLYGAAVNLLCYWVPETSVTQTSPSPDATKFTLAAPVGVYRGGDGCYFTVGAASDAAWRRLCAALGRADLTTDPRFASNATRVQNREALEQELHREFAAHPAESWVSELSRAGVPSTALKTVYDAVSSEFAVGSGFVIPDAEVDGLVAPGPIVRGAEASRPPRLSVPRLGEHTEAVLSDLGVGEDELNRLAACGAVMVGRRHDAVVR